MLECTIRRTQHDYIVLTPSTSVDARITPEATAKSRRLLSIGASVLKLLDLNLVINEPLNSDKPEALHPVMTYLPSPYRPR